MMQNNNEAGIVQNVHVAATSWTETNGRDDILPERCDRYYNILCKGGKMRVTFPVMNAREQTVSFWDTMTGAHGLEYPRSIIAFSGPIEVPERLKDQIRKSNNYFNSFYGGQ